MRATPAHIVAHAVRLIDSGVWYATAAKQTAKRFKCGVSEAAVRKWVRKRAAGAADAAPDSAPESTAPDRDSEDAAPPVHQNGESEPNLSGSDDGDDASLYERTLRMMKRAEARAVRAEADGNHSAAQRAQRDAATLMPVLARLEAARRAGADGVTFTREELEKARASVRARVAALASDLERTGGISCAHCGRSIRLALARGDDT